MNAFAMKMKIRIMTAATWALTTSAALPLSASGAKAEISFARGAWSSNDWIIVKSPRWNYMNGFVQRADCIENECPPLSGEEIHRSHGSSVYSAMVFKSRAEIGQTVSSVMSFDWRMAPLIVLAEKLDRAETGTPTFGEHWEVVLYDGGINVWRHMIRDGRPFWYKAAYLRVPFSRNTRYNLEVRVSRTAKGLKEMVVRCGGYELGYVDNDLPDSFYAGIIGCEGRNSFYDFRMR